jgi:dolichyl-phosphate beta-glucosyltransferase
MKISVIMPVRNQSAKLIKNLQEKVIPYFDKCGYVYEIIIVYDGSDEKNKVMLDKAMAHFPLQVKLVPYENIPGKGHNVKKGILSSTGDYVLFMDSDISTDLSVFDDIKPLLGHYDCFIATRFAKKSRITQKRSLIRKLTSWGSRMLIRAKFHFKGISDTQCGYKVFKGDVAKWMASKSIIDGFAFDVEYLYFLSLNHFSIKEMPVIWTNDENDSTVTPLKDSITFSKALKVIKKNKENYLLTNEEKKSLYLDIEEDKQDVN